MQLEQAPAAEACEEVYDADDTANAASGEKGEEAIFTCKFPGCTRQYASTDGALPDAEGSSARARRGGGAVWANRCIRDRSDAATAARALRFLPQCTAMQACL